MSEDGSPGRVLTPEDELAGWTVERGVTCVVAPCCGFVFSADHPDVATGRFTCPCCGAREWQDAAQRFLQGQTEIVSSYEEQP